LRCAVRSWVLTETDRPAYEPIQSVSCTGVVASVPACEACGVIMRDDAK